MIIRILNFEFFLDRNESLDKIEYSGFLEVKLSMAMIEEILVPLI